MTAGAMDIEFMLFMVALLWFGVVALVVVEAVTPWFRPWRIRGRQRRRRERRRERRRRRQARRSRRIMREARTRPVWTKRR